jgi:regulator of protease activity HflC (stomatin/prohibitin superfamily)
VYNLTPDRLVSVVGPYLQAITELQMVLGKVKGTPPTEVTIRSISQHSPISVEMTKVPDALAALRDMIVPARRKRAERLADFEQRQKAANIEKTRAETAEAEARANRELSEADKADAEAEKLREEATKTRLENIEMALRLLRQLAPNMPETEKIQYVVRLLGPIETLMNSPLTIVGDPLQQEPPVA